MRQLLICEKYFMHKFANFAVLEKKISLQGYLSFLCYTSNHFCIHFKYTTLYEVELLIHGWLANDNVENGLVLISESLSHTLKYILLLFYESCNKITFSTDSTALLSCH